jgi:thiol:disulfide interchange protein DsbA
MNKVLKIGFIISLLGFAFQAQAESADVTGYELITPAQPTVESDKIEVIEFFWYGCPHCYTFEPALNEWLKTQSDKINFIRMPAIFNAQWGKHAKAFFTAEALGVDEKLHADFFDVIQNKKQKLETEDQLAKFFVAHGIDEQTFRDHYNSFMVDTKMRKAQSMAPRYGVRSVPTIIINGKYKTNATIAKGQKNITVVMDQLIAAESAK